MFDKEQQNGDATSRSGHKIARPAEQSANARDKPTVSAVAVGKHGIAPQVLGPDDVLRLQRTIGNRAVSEFLVTSEQQQHVQHPASSGHDEDSSAARHRSTTPDTGTKSALSVETDNTRTHSRAVPANYTPAEFAMNGAHVHDDNVAIRRELTAQRPDVIQRMIVVDDDLDVSRLVAAVSIYKKWANKGKPERISTMRRADLSSLLPGEKLYLVAHGTKDDHGDRDAQTLATLLVERGFPLGEGNVVKLISCNTGDNESQSYAARLGNILRRTNTVVGIRGPETTDEGHTRGTKTHNESSVMDEYFKIIDGPEMKLADAIAARAKTELETCQESDIPKILLAAAEEIDRVGTEVFKKLEKLFEDYVKIMTKNESEYVHAGIGESRLAHPMGSRGEQPGEFNPRYPHLELSF